VPVLRVDQPMADKAVQMGPDVGVIATLKTTLLPTADLIRRRARSAHKKVKVTTRLCDGAFEALMGGDPAKHDALVAKALKVLAREVDVIVLAQASMARVVEGLPEHDRRVPVLQSPTLAIDHVAQIIGSNR